MGLAPPLLSPNATDTVEGTDVLSTGEAGGTKFLREDGDGTSSWQAPTAANVSLTTAPADLSMFVVLSQQPTGGDDLHTDTGIVYDSANQIFTITNILEVDEIREATLTSGVTIDGVLVKDSEISVLRTPTSTPASASDTGTTGTITWDSSYIYICTATDTWKRVAIATW